MDKSSLWIVLASRSPRRIALLERESYPFEVMPSEADELDAQPDDVHDIVIQNARLKGEEVARRLADRELKRPHEIVLAADTLVVQGNRVFGKPRDFEEAESFLQTLGGAPHQVLTGVYFYHRGERRDHVFYDETEVVLKKMNPEEIAALFAKVDPLDKAGGYGYQDAPYIVSAINGSRTNVYGLPMEALARELQAWLSPAATH